MRLVPVPVKQGVLKENLFIMKIVQRTWEYVSSTYVSIRQPTSAYVSLRQYTSAYVSIRQHTCMLQHIVQRTWEYVFTLGVCVHAPPRR